MKRYIASAILFTLLPFAHAQIGSVSIMLNGPSLLTNECHVPFIDPGAIILAYSRSLAGGFAHSLAVRADGTVLGWGDNWAGQVDIPANATNVTAVSAGDAHNLALRADGSVIGWGQGQASSAIEIPASATNVTAIAAGIYASLALRADGTVIGWGVGEVINIPASATNVIALAMGGDHGLALKADRTVIGWGGNWEGQVNIPPSAVDVVAIAAGFAFSLALKADGTVIGWGQASWAIDIPASATNVVAIAAGEHHSLALRADGTVIGWGATNYGQVTIPARATNVIAIAAGGRHNLALKADGTVIGWGDNFNGQITIPAGVSTLDLPIMIGGAVNPDVPNTYTLTYTATFDGDDLPAVTRTVVVADTIPPTLTLLGANPIQMAAGFPFTDPGAKATDLCAGDLTGNIIVSGSVNNATPGVYTLNYRVTDAAGHTTVTNRGVLVISLLKLGDGNGDGIVEPSELNLVLSNYFVNSPWLQMTNFAGLGGTQVTFSLSNSTAGAFGVEYTTNLTDWLFLGPATPRYEFHDTDAPASSQRYYRLRLP